MNNTIIICTSNYNNHNEIIKKLGAPIYSRFNAIIEFNNLSDKDVVKIINKEYEIQISNLSLEEKRIIEKENIINIIKSKSCVLKNVRNIRRIIQEAIYYTLVKKVINK